MVRSWGLPPSEFWQMTIAEILLEFESRRDRTEGDYAGKLTQADVEELAEMMRQS
jgi:hypothetical protein